WPSHHVKVFSAVGQCAAIFLQMLPGLPVVIGRLRDHVRHEKSGVVVFFGIGTVFGIAHMPAVESTSHIRLGSYLAEFWGKAFVWLECPSGGITNVVLLEVPAHPIRCFGLVVIRKDVLGTFNKEILPLFRVGSGSGRHSERDVAICHAHLGMCLGHNWLSDST